MSIFNNKETLEGFTALQRSNPELASASLAAVIAERRQGVDIWYAGVRILCPRCQEITLATACHATIPARQQPRLGGSYPPTYHLIHICAECGTDVQDARVCSPWEHIMEDGTVGVDLRGFPEES